MAHFALYDVNLRAFECLFLYPRRNRQFFRKKISMNYFLSSCFYVSFLLLSTLACLKLKVGWIISHPTLNYFVKFTQFRSTTKTFNANTTDPKCVFGWIRVKQRNLTPSKSLIYFRSSKKLFKTWISNFKIDLYFSIFLYKHFGIKNVKCRCFAL